VSEAADKHFVPAAGWRRWSGLYDATIAATMRESLFRGRLAEQVLADLSPGSEIVDVGAGTGTLAIALAAAAPTARVIGVDPDPEVQAIAKGKDGSEGVQWLAGFGDGLPLADGGCDRVVMSLVLHHLDAAGKRAALSEAHRVLRPGGRIHIADWGRAQDPLTRSTFFVLQMIDGFPGTRDHVAGRLPSFVEAAGFSQPRRHDRLRTAWGSLELLSAERPAA
jgi:ubiquinone/menaquinone biosynthesis C-methylase UbiE